ncbi:MAG: tRNA-(ms[2]io[6]A)-hydroxylase [Pseudomonadales bacterium]|jgi:tRNA-(ms[2]io[6]A)-hydroxylase|tara:strand:- start:1322 stop:1918 length:597 start_codon:yes stop_codon:yes gene_type:complete
MKFEQLNLVPTPDSWLRQAASDLPTLLIDHANCEKKAASTALNLMYRYVEYPALLQALSKLAREELRHFEQVLGIMAARGIVYEQMTSARYAGEMRRLVQTHEPNRLIDLLVMSAVIEARSCERFGRLCDVLDADLASFYGSLLNSEKRHFLSYLNFANEIAGNEAEVAARLSVFLAADAALITAPDEQFRFHSGAPD